MEEKEKEKIPVMISSGKILDSREQRPHKRDPN